MNKPGEALAEIAAVARQLADEVTKGEPEAIERTAGYLATLAHEAGEGLEAAVMVTVVRATASMPIPSALYLFSES